MTIQHAMKVGLLVVSMLATSALAQFPPGIKAWDVTQNGVVVGQLYVTGSGANYTEHWVLWPGYVTPGGGLGVEVKEGANSYSDVTKFLQGTPFPSGSKYVKATCEESTSLP